MSTRTDFERFDRELASLGVPPLSPWWAETVGRYLDAYDRGESLELWCCVGRGGSKSTTLYKLALFQALLGHFSIPDDERHYAIVLSRLRIEAEKGLAIIASWLRKLGVEHRAVGDTIDLAGLPRGVRVVTASVAGASGFRAFFVGADEFAKWRWEGSPDLDADEVLASARAMLATHPRALVMVASSPWMAEGSFYQAITAGDVLGRSVPPATPSWVANPLIGEASTRLREPNPRRHAREYGAEFVDAFEGGFFPTEAIAACTDRGRLPGPLVPRAGVRSFIVAIDPAFSFDRFGVAIAHAEDGRTGPVVVVDYIGTIDPPMRGMTLSPERAVAAVATLRRAWPGGAAVFSDQFSATSLAEAFLRRGIFLRVEPWTQTSKLERFTLARSLMVDGRLRLPDDPATRRELGSFGVKMNPSGTETITSRGSHDDRVSALVHAAALAHARAPSYGRAEGGAAIHPRLVPMDGTHRTVG